MTTQLVLLTGATGFVGNALFPSLRDAGCRVRCLTRDPAAARSRWPDRDWIAGDLDRPDGLEPLLAGCDTAYYLVHGMRSGAPDYRAREETAARRFAEAAGRAGVDRIVYLGGVAPRGTPSEHLASRLAVGEILRAGPIPALELRAGVIVGPGSTSWRILRDLSARLPVMVLPGWLRSSMEPVAIEDVVVALVRARTVRLPESAWYDLPGPERMTGKELLVRTAEALGLRPPWMISVPFLSLGLSAYWLRLVTRADWTVAKELVQGLGSDLLAESEEYWRLIGHEGRLGFEKAARGALAGEPIGSPSGPGGYLERVVGFTRRSARSRSR
jgi:uncharacterized protein YbjT (DUF2867 family)